MHCYDTSVISGNPVTYSDEDFENGGGGGGGRCCSAEEEIEKAKL
jgi:hypothetical protein